LRTGGADNGSLTSGAPERMPPVIRVTTLDEIVDNYDSNKSDTDVAHKGKWRAHSIVECNLR